ncbi:BTAD domain-containing putative transcriptional regulator [Actinoplanes sp. NPDC051494]|uniref:AfsR/SARP family transcriptional regulator n=1 Tax=Actinoplanes sp. NPDC051494 TaxID=3363907 RepID=UPI0037B69BE9
MARPAAGHDHRPPAHHHRRAPQHPRQHLTAPLLTTTERRYQLDPTAIDVDLWQFTTAIAATNSAVSSPQRQNALAKVVERYHGDLAGNTEWPWLAEHRETVRTHALETYTELAAHAPPEHAITLLRAAATIDPLHEGTHRQLISLLIETGDHDAANRLYVSLTTRIANAGLSAGSALTDLADQLARG